jgi:phage head maturation protease
MKIYLPIAKVDAAQRMVWGYASTEARDEQGEIIKREALAAALGDYMKFGNIREMHQLSAVGKAKDAAVDDKGLYLGAKVVDDQAWNKVIEGVYSGYSIGGKVTTRDPADYKTITGLRLDEISLVDRPANPEAVFDCWKRGATAEPPLSRGQADPDDPVALLRAAIERVEALVKKGDDEPYGPLEETSGVDYADPGYQDDKKKRYPIDGEKHIRAAWNYINKPKNAGKYSAEQVKHIKAKIVSAWKDKIDPKGPPAADDEEKAARVELKKHLYDVGSVAQVILQLDWLKDALATEAIVEGDDSPQAARLSGIVDELCGFLNALVAEETAEIKSDSEDPGSGSGAGMSDDGPGSGPGQAMMMAAIASSLAKSGLAGRAKLFADLAKAKHSMGDQALLDCAHMAVEACAKIDGMTTGEKDQMAECSKFLKAAGAKESSGIDSTQNTANNPTHPAPQDNPPPQEYRPGVYTTWNSAEHTSTVLEIIAAALGKRGRAHQALMDVAHACMNKVTDGKTCEPAGQARGEKAGGRHSKETMGHLQEAHDHLVAAGAKCDAAGEMDGPGPAAKPGAEEEDQGTEFEGKTVRLGDLKKMLTAERTEKAALAKAVAEMTPRPDAILKTVEKIDRTPLPPLTRQMDFRATAGLTRLDKGRETSPGLDPGDEALMARIASMSPDEQAMLLIKASRLKPMRVPGMPPAFAGAGLPAESGNG